MTGECLEIHIENHFDTVDSIDNICEKLLSNISFMSQIVSFTPIRPGEAVAAEDVAIKMGSS